MPTSPLTRRAFVMRALLAGLVACAAVPLIGPAIAAWATRIQRERLIVAQLTYQAQHAIDAYVRKVAQRNNAYGLADQHDRAWRVSFDDPSNAHLLFIDPAAVQRKLLRDL